MGAKVKRVRYSLDAKGIKNLPRKEIEAILRGADDLIMRGGRNLLSKVLKGSRDRKVLEFGLDRSPVYGFYNHLPLEQISARIDWLIIKGYLRLDYDYRLPLLAYTGKGWEIEKDTYSDGLIQEFDKMLESEAGYYNMSYLKDKNRALIWMLLDKVEASRKKEYIPILQAWEGIDYKKVQNRIRQVIKNLDGGKN